VGRGGMGGVQIRTGLLDPAGRPVVGRGGQPAMVTLDLTFRKA
jgi:hypothetical protein